MNTPWTFDGEEILDCRGAKVITAHAEFIGAGIEMKHLNSIARYFEKNGEKLI
jgi:hypothetical protein